MAEDSLKRIEFKSTDSFIDYTRQPINLFKRVYLKDSLFRFFPYAEVYLSDMIGAIGENAFFIEGLEFDIKIGNADEGYLVHKFVWTENQYNETGQTAAVGGTNAFVFLSTYYKKDLPKSRAWMKKLLSDVAKDIASTDYGIESKSQKISNTVGQYNWYQCNELTNKRIQSFAERGSSQNYSKHPMYSFINLLGEFYFMSLGDLYAQSDVLTNEYVLEFSLTATTNHSVIQQYDLMYGGMPVNKKNYNKTVYKNINDGSAVNESTQLKDHITKIDNKGKLLVKTSDISVPTSFIDFGIYEDPRDKEFYQGYINSFFMDTALSYRMSTTIHFTKEAAAGKIIKLKIFSGEDTKVVNSELSGKWLILESQHYLDSDGIPYTNLLLAKSTIDLNSKYKFNSEFVS
jgi:hypothetical protein